MKWVKGPFLHQGKGKTVYAVKDTSHLVWMEFKDSLTAFNGKKKSQFSGKGGINRDISSLAFRYLKNENIDSHWLGDTHETGMICEKLKIIPLEVVVRNRLAGSTAKKFQIPEGEKLSKPLVEFYYKNDELGDPFISSEQALAFSFVSQKTEIEYLTDQALLINQKLKVFFDMVHLELIDFKLEFGAKLHPDKIKKSSLQNKVNFVLGDEISCDTCRLWDKKTGEKRDKDRFRLGLGQVAENYQQVREILSQYWTDKLKK